MNEHVLVLGSTCVDVIIRVDHLPVTEENLHPSGQTFRVGGCAYNVANILGRGGARTTFITPVGMTGVFGPYLLPVLKKQSWIRPVLLPDQQNGCCYCLVEKSGERTFLSIHGAEYTFDPAWMTPCNGETFDYTYLCGLEVEESTGDKLIDFVSQASTGRLFYAPGPRGAKIERTRTERLLALHPLLHLNRQEALVLSGADDLPRALAALQEKTGSPVIVTLGADGALLYEDGQTRHLPGEKAGNIVDTIGAGDAHAGAVLLGLSQSMSLPDAIRLGNRVSAQVVQTEGATLSDEALQIALQ